MADLIDLQSLFILFIILYFAFTFLLLEFAYSLTKPNMIVHKYLL